MNERLNEEVKAMRRRGQGKVYCQMKDNQTVLVAIPGPEKTEWEGGLYSIVVKCSNGKDFGMIGQELFDWFKG